MLAFCSNFQVFSKLSEQRFPSELELQELIGSRIPDSQEPVGNKKPDSQDLVLDDGNDDDDDPAIL
jgi:hypothetical protein